MRFLFAVAFLVLGANAKAQISSTNCVETEIPLDGFTSVSKLDRCGDDVNAPLLWHLDRIDQVDGVLDGHFDRRNGGAGSVIYVMDTGVLASHAEFATASGASRVVAGFDETQAIPLGRSKCISDNKAIAPCFENIEELASASHGTGVASIAAGKNVGVAPDATIVSIRVMNERGLATTRTYLDGLNAIVAHAWAPASPNFRTAVVNISGWVLERLSGVSARDMVSYAAVEQKIRDMIAGVDAKGHPDPNGKRFLFVVAANNTDGGCGPAGTIDRFPALLGHKIEGVITVGGMTADNHSWNGTCRGGVEVLAPAQGIFSATITASDHYRGRRPNLRSGTSFAAPIISGIAARMLSERPDLTPQQLEWWIAATPSRVDDPSAQMADGRVGFVPAPAAHAAAVTTTARAALER
ncbi:MAG TPA: S8 family serine peptidase [Thermoanaerobaculia bacterium]|nr:S8 family serine peptidase [Thermoanaerobaculia bacterium]